MPKNGGERMSIYWDDELYHYGVQGMKWGVVKNRSMSVVTPYKGKISKKSYAAAKQYAKAKAQSDWAKAHEEDYHSNKNISYAIVSDSNRIKQAKMMNKYNKQLTKLSDQEMKQVKSVVKKLGSQSVSSLSKDTIYTGRAVVSSMHLGQMLFGIPGGLATYSIGTAIANNSSRVKNYDNGKYKTVYDKRGHITSA